MDLSVTESRGRDFYVMATAVEHMDGFFHSFELIRTQ